MIVKYYSLQKKNKINQNSRTRVHDA